MSKPLSRRSQVSFAGTPGIRTHFAYGPDPCSQVAPHKYVVVRIDTRQQAEIEFRPRRLDRRSSLESGRMDISHQRIIARAVVLSALWRHGMEPRKGKTEVRPCLGRAPPDFLFSIDGPYSIYFRLNSLSTNMYRPRRSI